MNRTAYRKADGRSAVLTISLALAVAMAVPALAESRYDSSPDGPDAPVGLVAPEAAYQTEPLTAPRPGALTTGTGSGTVIVTNGPIIILPGHSDPVPAPLTPSRHPIETLPLACIETVPVNRGDVRLMEARCLEAAGVNVRALPNRCGVQVRSRGETVRGFDPACLGDAGYRLARR